MFLKPFILIFVIGFFATVQSKLNLKYLFCKRMCPSEFEPICATNGKTYSSVCQFKCARIINQKIHFKSIGLCGDRLACSALRNKRTGCGSRFTNILTKLYREDCLSCGCIKKGKPIACSCTRELNPVCGTDRKTYLNICEFKKGRLNNPSLMILSFGKCKSKHPASGPYIARNLYDGCGPIELPKPCPEPEPCRSSSSTK